MSDFNQNQTTKSPGRNDPCPCGSGKKFKKCCGLSKSKLNSRVVGNGDINSGFALYRQGDVEEALSIASRLIRDNPEMPEAYALEGMCKFSKGEFSAAKEALLKVEGLANLLKDKTNIPNYKVMLATLEYELGNYKSAELYAREALDLGLNDSLTHNVLGAALAAQEKFKEAKGAFLRALEFEAKDAELWENLGVCNYRLFEYSEAVACFKKALSLNSELRSSNKQLGLALMELYKYGEAIEQFLQYLKKGKEDAFITSNLGAAYAYQNQLDEAFNWLTRSQNLDPGLASTYLAFAIFYLKKGESENCKKNLRKALEIEPENVSLRVKILEILEEICAIREREEVLVPFKKIQSPKPAEIESLIPALLRLNYTNVLSLGDIKRMHVLVGEYLSNKAINSDFHHEIAAYKSNSKIKIGYVSTDFREHSVGYFIRNIIKAHDPNKFEIYCYADLGKSDLITQEIKSSVSHFKNITSLDDESAAKIISDDQIQILVDLNGYTERHVSRTSRLPVFAYGPAPVQIAYLGYPNTTGVNALKYRITDSYADFPDSTQFTEKLIYMPECFLCFGDFPGQKIELVTAFERNGYVTFGSFNNTAKLTTEVITVWASILHRVQKSKILIKAFWLKDEIARENIYQEFERNGIERHRIQLLGIRKSKTDHLSLYNDIDIALDTFPYNGTTTTCEALWMGVPVITLLGKLHAQRVSYSILKNIGHEELVAQNEKEYIDIACDLAANQEFLRALRKRIPQDLSNSILCNPERFTRQLEQVYLNAWDKYSGG